MTSDVSRELGYIKWNDSEGCQPFWVPMMSRATYNRIEDLAYQAKRRTMKATTPASVEILKEYNIPHNDGVIDLDAWAKQFGFTIDEKNQLINEDGLRGVAYPPGYRAGWSTWNGGAFLPTDASAILVALTMNAHKDHDEMYNSFDEDSTLPLPVLFLKRWLMTS